MIEFHMKGFGKWCPKLTKNHFLDISLPMVGLGIWSVTTLFTLIRSECNKDVIYSFYFFKNFFLSNNSISYYIVNWNIFESFIPNGTHMWMDVRIVGTFLNLELRSLLLVLSLPLPPTYSIDHCLFRRNTQPNVLLLGKTLKHQGNYAHSAGPHSAKVWM